MWQHLGGLLVEATAAAPDSAALIVGPDRRPITYAELDRRVDAKSAELTGCGLRTGDVIALAARNSAEYVVALLAAARAGIVVAPLDPAMPVGETQRRVDLVGARAVLDEAAEAGPLRDAHGPAGLRRDDALVMLTSGTTGSPKMVPWTHTGLAASVGAVVDSYGLTTTDATVAVMPLFHGHGLVATLLATLTTGGTLVLPVRGNFTAHTFWDDMAAAKATWYTAVPTIHRIVLQRAAPGGPDAERPLPALRFVRSCSAPLSPDLLTDLERRFGAPVLGAYGMTETTHQASTVRPGDATAVRLHTVGRPAGLVARVTADDGTDCRPGESGEIRLHGPTVMRGYLGEGAADAFSAGWLRTGDLGLLDLDGNLVVTGRIKNLINRGGEKISPEHVEQILTSYPDVIQAAVVGVPDDLYGERVAAAIVTAAPVDLEQVTAFCRTRLAPFEIPQLLVPVPELPLTAKGDVDRVALTGQLAGAVSGR